MKFIGALGAAPWRSGEDGSELGEPALDPSNALAQFVDQIWPSPLDATYFALEANTNRVELSSSNAKALEVLALQFAP